MRRTGDSELAYHFGGSLYSPFGEEQRALSGSARLHLWTHPSYGVFEAIIAYGFYKPGVG